ncbi:MAG: ABC transporter ATP-binding protein [Eggerthellaceae bacterium]|jgi:iron complex transport system ATP-binding protein|nr:ABC transporter ATP-binding protein [Eggerthellaceae bacterium]
MKLTVDNITFGYNETTPVLKGVSFTYETPDVLCILGANGTGKSTLLRCIVGELNAQCGCASVDGKAIKDYSAKSFACKVAYIPQTHTPTFAYSAIDIVAMGRTAHMGYFASPSEDDIAHAQEQLEYLGIGHLRDQPYTEVSGGEQQLIIIAAALAQDPELLILDEPTAHLDFGNQYKFIQLVERLREKGIGVLMTTHFPDHALALGGTTAILSDGIIQHIGPAAKIVTSESMSKLYDIEAHVLPIGDRRICLPGKVHHA